MSSWSGAEGARWSRIESLFRVRGRMRKPKKCHPERCTTDPALRERECESKDRENGKVSNTASSVRTTNSSGVGPGLNQIEIKDKNGKLLLSISGTMNGADLGGGKMKLQLFFLLLVLACQNGWGQQAAHSGPAHNTNQSSSKRYFAGSDDRWLSVTKSSMDKTLASGEPIDSAIVSLTNGRVRRVDLTQQVGSGDWTLYAHYTFDVAGSATHIDSVLNTFHGNVRVKRTFQLMQGKVVSSKTEIFDLTTLQPIAKCDDFEDIETPIYKTVHDLPFSSLLSEH